MFVAFDKEKNRIYADEATRHKDCFCPVCGEPLIHRKGKYRRPHFAHKQKTDCFMSRNKDYLSEWHMRMQDYFPKEKREVRFQDDETGEVHIADVFDEETNTVIEFQHSPINEEEYLSRTSFHLKNGRRIAWIFDESKEKEKEGYLGRLKPDSLFVPLNWKIRDVNLEGIYKDLSYKWLYARRKMLAAGPDLIENNKQYSVFVFAGETEDIIHRIINEENAYEYITISVQNLEMAENMNPDEFFNSERVLLSQSPWKEKIDEAKEQQEEEKRILEARIKEYREQIRIISRERKGYDSDLTKCPLCGGKMRLKTAKRGINEGRKFYGCSNYPKCRFTEDC